MVQIAPRFAIPLLIAVLVTSALWLYAERGSAILLDLAASSRAFLCL